MDAPINYQVIFTGKLRKGYEAAAVKQALTQRLKLPREQVERLFASSQTVLKKTPSVEQAKHIVTQLAAAGAVATIVPNPVNAGASAARKTTAAPAVNQSEAFPTGIVASDEPLPEFSPFRNKALFKPMLFAAAGAEVLLGLLYAGLIFWLLFGVMMPSLFSTWGGEFLGSPLLGLPLQIIAFVLGTLALLIVIKPLLALRPGRHRGIVISPEQEPDLHAFIEDLCERIEAPVPSEIRLYNEAGVRTAYYKGPLGFFRNEPVLSIGVPVIAWMTCSQLAAFIGLSLNRFRHPNSPRASGILLASNSWLQRAVYEDDPVEAAVRRWHKEGRIGDKIFELIEKYFSAARKLAYWRMELSRQMGRHLIHRTVAEGDKMALAFCGTEGFVRMLDQSNLLAFASKNVLPSLTSMWDKKGELPDSLVQLMVLRARQYPANMPQKLREMQEQRKAAIGDVLPSDTQRLKRIEHQPIQGTYRCLSPASILFRNYAKRTHTMTLRFYHHRLQLPVSPYHLKQLPSKGSMEQQLQQRLDHYFQKLYVDFVPFKLSQHMRTLNSEAEAKKLWAMAEARIRSEYKRAKVARDSYDVAEAGLVNTASRELMHLAGLGKEWESVTLKSRDLDEVHQSARDAEEEHSQATRTLEQYTKAYAMRLGAALAILEKDENLPQKIKGLRQESQILISLLERIDTVHEQLRELKLHTLLLETLLSYSTLGKKQKLEDHIEQYTSDCEHMVTSIGVALKSAPYPYSDSKQKKLMRYVLEDALRDESPQGSFDRGYDTIKRLARVQQRAIVRLAMIGEQVAKIQGLSS